ncbi:sigma-54-dependent transcriptional regulator [Desulfococcus sp.]|uniref:sigma-54-dependent transcriptional regulator n=1 Tax=Desulfococcus sp. TaxID=2025834 RepID=UPI003593FF60
MTPRVKILFVDDDRFMRQSFVELIANYDYQIKTANDGLDALAHLQDYPADIVITDLMMPNMDGHALLEALQTSHPEVFVLVVTGSSNIEDAVKAMKSGAYDYILKPFVFNSIIAVIEGIIGFKNASGRAEPLRESRRNGLTFRNIVGQDPAMTELYERIDALATTNATVLITGETGTGKDLTAKAIHDNSLRKSGPFVRVNCAALTDTISNSEVFGHEKGAFTGAVTTKVGCFETAEGGSLFLDEIGDLSLTTQAALLQCIETRTFQRVGGARTIKANVRMICATNRNLAKLVEEKRFRAVLFDRINVVSLVLPPLRERVSDIPLLADHFLQQFNEKAKKNITGISNAATEILKQHVWPGNVRELANVIENAAIFCKGRKIVPADIQDIRREPSHKSIRLNLSSWSLDHAEETLIRGALYETRGNLKHAAETLGIARGTLYSKMKRYGIEKA